MAYPFAQAPTTAELVDRLKRQGATEHTTSEVTGPKGPLVFRYLKRVTKTGTMLSEPLDADEDLVGWDKLRRVCRQLGVDPRDLNWPGLHLG